MTYDVLRSLERERASLVESMAGPGLAYYDRVARAARVLRIDRAVAYLRGRLWCVVDC